MGGIQYLESPQLSESHSIFLQLEFSGALSALGTHASCNWRQNSISDDENNPSSFSPAVPCCLLPSESGYQRQRVKHGGVDCPARSGTRCLDTAGSKNRKDRVRF